MTSKSAAPVLRVGIVGVGRAGMARVHAVRARADAVLVGVHGGRAAGDVGVPVRSSVAALAKTCDLLVVCSPSAVHPMHVRQGLTAGCHVLCEFPLAGSGAEAQRLFAEANRAGRRLLVEHIELLSPSTVFMAGALAGHRLLGGELTFSRTRVGTDLTDHVARLHRLWAICGPLRLSHATRRCDDGEVLVHARFVGRDEAAFEVCLREGPSWPRALSLRVDAAAPSGSTRSISLQGREVCVDGARVRVHGAAGGLFALDLGLAIQAVQQSAPFYASRCRVVSVLQAITDLRDGF